MDHDDGRFAARAIVAVSHRHRGVLMRHRDETRITPIALTRQRLDNRGEVGSRVYEDVFDTPLGKSAEIRLSGDLRRHVHVHSGSPCEALEAKGLSTN